LEFLRWLRDCEPDQVERLKDGELNGRTVERYRVLPESPFSEGADVLVTVDPLTHLPVRIEQRTDKFGGLLHVVCKDFSFASVIHHCLQWFHQKAIEWNRTPIRSLKN
jgi:hypothetical protein